MLCLVFNAKQKGDYMQAQRLVHGVVAAILAGNESERQSRLDAFEGMLRDAASLAYDRAAEHKGNEEATTFYLREWSHLGCAADYVQGIYVGAPRVTPQLTKGV